MRVVVGYDKRGCLVCRRRVVERHRLQFGEWGGEYEKGNVVLLCPTHHKLTHVVTWWRYASMRGEWAPHANGSQGNVCKLIGYAAKADPKFWLFYWHVQHPVVLRRIGTERGMEPPPVAPLVDRVRKWRSVWRSDELYSPVGSTDDVAGIDDLRRHGE